MSSRETGFIRSLLESYKTDIDGLLEYPSLHADIEFCAQELSRCSMIYCLGVGKSHDVAHKVAGTLQSCGIHALAPTTEELLHGGLTLFSEKENGYIFFTKSARTKELLRTSYGVSQNFHVVITGSLSHAVNMFPHAKILNYVMPEHDVLNMIPTRSVVCMLIIGDMLAMSIARLRGSTYHHLHEGHPFGAIGEFFDKDEHYDLLDRTLYGSATPLSATA